MDEELIGDGLEEPRTQMASHVQRLFRRTLSIRSSDGGTIWKEPDYDTEWASVGFELGGNRLSDSLKGKYFKVSTDGRIAMAHIETHPSKPAKIPEGVMIYSFSHGQVQTKDTPLEVELERYKNYYDLSVEEVALLAQELGQISREL